MTHSRRWRLSACGRSILDQVVESFDCSGATRKQVRRRIATTGTSPSLSSRAKSSSATKAGPQCVRPVRSYICPLARCTPYATVPAAARCSSSPTRAALRHRCSPPSAGRFHHPPDIHKVLEVLKQNGVTVLRSKRVSGVPERGSFHQHVDKN